MKNSLKSVAVLILFFSLLIGPFQQGGITTRAATPYTEYYVAYTDNYHDGNGAILFITSPKGAYGTVEIPGLNWSQGFSVAANQISKVLLPLSAELQGSDTVVNKGIRVRANNTILVYLLNPGEPVFSNDAYTALPVETLGQDYFVMSWPDTIAGQGYAGGQSEMAVLAPYNNTVLTIVPSISTGTHAAGVPYNITLNQFEVYTLQSDNAYEDLTGTSIHSSLPVSVFTGNRCVFIPAGSFACDHIVEQMLPVNAWGKSYFTYPMATKTKGDFLRIISATDGNSVSVNGPVTTWQMSNQATTSMLRNNAVELTKDPTGMNVGILDNLLISPNSKTQEGDPEILQEATTSTQQVNRGQALTLLATGPLEITSSEPVLVAQFSTSQDFDSQGDPLMMLIPPAQQFLSNYTFLVPTGYSSNFVNIIIPTDAINSIKLDGTSVNLGLFKTIGSQGYSGASVSLSTGSHTIYASKPFAIYVYGFGTYVSYGYPGGLGTSTINPTIDPNAIPVIVIPGVGGSKFENDQGELWPGVDMLCDDRSSHYPFASDNLHLDVLRLNDDGTKPLVSDDPHYSTVKTSGVLETVAGQCIIKVLGKERYNDYVSIPIYKNLTENLERVGYQRNKNLFLFDYDWRRDISETSAQLDALIEQVRKGGQVNIIAHSMGGLVARNYILDSARAAKVKNLAILGTPFLGSPDALEVLLFGTDMDINDRVQQMVPNYPFVELVNEEKVHEIAQNWPGVYELLPSERYLNVYPEGLIQENNIDKNGDGKKNGILDYPQTIAYYLKQGFNTKLVPKAEAFRTDDLEGFDKSGTKNVNVIIFAGAGQPTHLRIEYSSRTKWLGLKTEDHAYWHTGNGDGTVPLHSVDLQANNNNYRGTAKVYYVNDGHFNLVGNSDVFNQILQVFGFGKFDPVNANISTDSTKWMVNGTAITIFSPVDLHIYNALGNHLGPTVDADIEYGIPGAQYDIIGHDKMAFVPAGIPYYALLDGTDTGTFDMVIENISNDNVTKYILFKSISVTPTTKARISLSEQDGYLLSIDQNDDGIADVIIPPSSVLDGNVSEDNISPTSNIILGPVNENGELSVDISANDNPGGSGILEIQYSLDEGNTFLIYNETFTINANQVQRVISKAVDKVGNEEFPLTIAIVESNKPPTLSVPLEQHIQYSDELTFTVSATDLNDPSNTLTFSVTGLPNYITLKDNGDGTATISGVANVAPNTYTAQITVTDPGGLSDTKPVNIIVSQEDARATYTGPMFVSTSSITSSMATVQLRTTIQDITAVDPNSDPNPGNITNATVTFVNRDTSAVLCTTNVILLDPANQTVGTGSCNWNVNIGSSDGVDYTIGTIVSGYYTHNSTAEDTVVVVSKPVSNFITGGGYFINQSSGGKYAGDKDAKTNFGLTIKFTKKLTNLQGRITIIVRQNGHTYQIKTNALTSLVTIPYDPTKPKTGTAELVGKANVIDVTDPLFPVVVNGNATINVVMKDNGEPGNTDLISISLWGKDGSLLFSSNWNGVKTILQLLAGGSLNVK